MPLSSLHTVRLLASIARQEGDHLTTLADAGSEESGLESLHTSSDESDTEPGDERGLEAVNEASDASDDKLGSEQNSYSTSESSRDALPISAAG